MKKQKNELQQLKQRVIVLVNTLFETVEELDTRYRDLDQKVEHFINDRE